MVSRTGDVVYRRSAERAASGPRPADFDQRDFRCALGSFATGVAVVTTIDLLGRPIGLTVNSFSAVSLHPPLVLWSLMRDSPKVPAFTQRGRFAVSVLAADQVELCRRFSAPVDDRFAGLKLSFGAGGMPLIDAAVAHFECCLSATFPGGDHLLLLGEVERYAWCSAPTLAFCHGRLRPLHPNEVSIEA